MASTKKKVGIGVGAVLALAVFGSCLNDDDRAPGQAAPSPAPTTTKTVPMADRTEWAGTVVGYSDYDTDLIVDVDGKSQTVGLANVGPVHCGGAYSANRQAQKDRVAQLVPIGSAVRIARTTEYGGRLSSDGFVYVETRTAASTTTTTTSARPTTSASATSTPRPAGPTTTSDIAGSGTTVNAALMSEGLAAMDPAIDLSVVAPTPAAEAIAKASAANAIGASATHLPAMLDAYRAAWDTRVGLQALCRADDDTAIREAEQRKELDRLKAGPDGVLYTSDDDNTWYRYDEAGNMYVEETPSSSTGDGGGWGGGESRFCSRRWWC